MFQLSLRRASFLLAALSSPWQAQSQGSVTTTLQQAPSTSETSIAPDAVEALSPPEGATQVPAPEAGTAQKSDESLSCAELGAETERQLALWMGVISDMNNIKVSDAPAKAAATGGKALGFLSPIVGTLGGGIAGGIASAVSGAATIAAGEAARAKMMSEFDKKADAAQGQFDTAEARWTHLNALYQSKCE